MRHQQTPIQLNISHISEREVKTAVWQKVIYAIKQRRIVQFNYQSPIHETAAQRRHLVEPYEHYYRNGHFYLKAYCLQWVAPDGRVNGRFWANPYRLDYIQPDELLLLGTFQPRQRQPALTEVRYKLSPRIVRGGISRWFTNMTVDEPDSEGWVEVRGETDNEFDAYRILLAYGKQCVVLSPDTLVDRFRDAVEAMGGYYRVE